MNYSDAERFAAKLDELGYKETANDKEADLIVLITCSVRKSAEDRVYGAINNYRKKKLYPKVKKIILSGCMALRSEVLKKTDKADIFMDIKDLKVLPQLLKQKAKSLEIGEYFSIKPKYASKFMAYVPIMTGCNNFCSYCIVPYVRGREISRQPQEIINEVKDLIRNGYKEIILLGQNVNSYSPELRAQSSKLKIKDFPDLLEYIAKLPGNFWLRFITSHPKDLSDKLIRVMAKNKKICEQINLPIQSGDNVILKKMNRHYTVAHYKYLVRKLRKNIPGIAISTDVIVGFPEETKKQFGNTAKLFKEVKFDMAYINKYSPREETAAARLKDNISKAEKVKRAAALTKVLSSGALENNKKLVGKTLDVLVISRGRKGDWIGETRTSKMVKFKSEKNLLGKFININIIEAKDFGLIGMLTKK